MRPPKILSLVFVFLGLATQHHLLATTIKFSSERTAFYRYESPTVGVVLDGDFPEQSVLDVKFGEYLLHRGPARQGRNEITLPTHIFRSGSHDLTARLLDPQGNQVASQSFAIQLVRRIADDALQNWLWMNGGPVNTAFYKEHGFDYAGGPMLPYSFSKDNSGSLSEQRAAAFRQVSQILNKSLGDGLLLSAVPNGGLFKREFTLFPPNGEDIEYVNAARHGEKYYNPFSPIVAEKQNEANRLFLEAIKDYPNFTIAWTDMEIQDDLTKPNLNREGREKMAKELGFTVDEVGDPEYVAEHVISDNDRKYRLSKYIFQGGNGIQAGLQRMVDMVKEYRPDVLTMTDPYRHAALYDVYPSIDIIHSWTYSSPDPKSMLYIEQLRTVCKPRNQIPLQIVTLLDYPGILDVPERRKNYTGKLEPHEGWMMMGPDRVKETTWINLSRAPRFVGYFYSSMIDPVKYRDDTYRIPPETSDAIREMAEKVFRPYGKMIRKLEVSPRRIAVLTSQAAAVYNRSPGDEGSYVGYRTLPFQGVLEMAHYNADVVFDESIERGMLDNYDVLFLPRCDTLTQSVVEKIHNFRKRGGLVFADKYLGPQFDGVHRFDFDFSYLSKVNARANVMGETYAEWNDQVETSGAKVDLKKVLGVPAQMDQEIKEGYAKTLKEVVGQKVPHIVDCDEPTVLFNLCEKNGVKYLFVINDKRTYDERVGKYKGIMEKLVPQTVNVRLRDQEGLKVTAYDMLRKCALPVSRKDSSLSFPVELGALGGTIIALYPSPLEKIAISAPAEGVLSQECAISVTFHNAEGKPAQGLQPVRIDILDAKGNIHEDSDWICLENGKGKLSFTPAWNDPAGGWKIKASDLTAGLSAETNISFTQPDSQ